MQIPVHSKKLALASSIAVAMVLTTKVLPSKKEMLEKLETQRQEFLREYTYAVQLAMQTFVHDSLLVLLKQKLHPHGRVSECTVRFPCSKLTCMAC